MRGSGWFKAAYQHKRRAAMACHGHDFGSDIFACFRRRSPQAAVGMPQPSWTQWNRSDGTIMDHSTPRSNSPEPQAAQDDDDDDDQVT